MSDITQDPVEVPLTAEQVRAAHPGLWAVWEHRVDGDPTRLPLGLQKTIRKLMNEEN